MKNSALVLAAAIVATTASVAAAQSSISDFRGPVAPDYNAASGVVTMNAPTSYATDEARFNDFSGPVVRQ